MSEAPTSADRREGTAIAADEGAVGSETNVERPTTLADDSGVNGSAFQLPIPPLPDSLDEEAEIFPLVPCEGSMPEVGKIRPGLIPWACEIQLP